MLSALVAGFDRPTVLFLADRGHSSAVSEILSSGNADESRIEFEDLQVHWNRSFGARIWDRLTLLRRIRAVGAAFDPQASLYLSATRIDLELLAILPTFTAGRRNTYVVVHGLEYLTRRPPLLSRVAPGRRVTHLGLAAGTVSYAQKCVPSLRSLRPIDFPSLTPRVRPAAPAEGETIVFGTMGAGWRRGSDGIFEVASALKKAVPGTVFRSVGRVRDASTLPAGWTQLVEVPSAEDLDYEGYLRLGTGLDWLVWLGSPQYDLAASGALVDGIRLGRPVIALETALTRGYFEKFGPIGYLCGDMAELVRVATRVAERPPAGEEWSRISEALCRAQDAFEPASVGRQIAAMVAGQSTGRGVAR